MPDLLCHDLRYSVVIKFELYYKILELIDDVIYRRARRPEQCFQW